MDTQTSIQITTNITLTQKIQENDKEKYKFDITLLDEHRRKIITINTYIEVNQDNEPKYHGPEIFRKQTNDEYKNPKNKEVKQLKICKRCKIAKEYNKYGECKECLVKTMNGK